MKYLPFLILLCGCARENNPPEQIVPSDLKTLATTQPALVVSSGTNRYALIHWRDDLWHVYPIVEQGNQ